MKKVNLILAFAILVIGLTACGGKQTTPQSTGGETPDMHTSENSLDFYGTYQGTLPCADCEGIKTQLLINKDKTFVLQSQYIGKETDAAQKTGNFVIKNDIIHLDLGNNQYNYYKIQEGNLKFLDQDLKPIEGDLAAMYILQQTDVQYQ